MKKENPYKNDPQFFSTNQACEFVGVHPITFKKYIDRFCFQSFRHSKYTYYRKEDVEAVRDFFSWGAQELITRLETLTGKKVQLI